MKPVPDKIVVGNLGESHASVAFQNIHWAPLTKIEQDIGDDRFTLARVRPDPSEPRDAWDVSAPVFIQVKGSRTRYSKASDNDQGRSGWWFTESDTDHFDHWLRFGLPYLLVLQHVDDRNPVTYWAEVKADAIVSTGKGRKIFVPSDQRVDDSSLDALNALAVADRADPLEGAAWNGGLVRLGPADRLRNGLIVPRLVAPHPNGSPKRIDYEQAVALLMQNRGRDLHILERRNACPPRETWARHRIWGWRFVAALSVLLETGSTADLDSLAETTRSIFERDACKVVIACASFVDGSPQDALSLLVPSRGSKPADRGWLLAQRAWMLLELDQSGEAAGCAEESLFAIKSLQGDRSVSAIRGGAAAALFSASDAATGSLAVAIAAQDNAGSWWRAQSVGFALGRDLAGRFREWADDDPDASESLRAASDLDTLAWNAAFSASWGGWRQLSVQAAQIVLTTSRDDQEISKALMRLTACGARKEVRSAARRIWSNGPVDALNECVVKAATMPWLRRSEGAVLALLERAGDLLSNEEADSAIHRVLELLSLGAVRVFSGGWTDRWSEIDKALARLLTAAGASGHQECAQIVSSSLAAGDSRVEALVTVAESLDLEQLTVAQLDDLYQSALRCDLPHRIDLLSMLAPQVPRAERDLSEMARGGSDAASRALLSAGLLSPQDWIVLGRSSRRKLLTMLADGRGDGGQRRHSMLTVDPLRDLVSSAFHTGNVRHWKLMTDALAEGVLAAGHVVPTLEVLVANFGDLPPNVQKRLRNLGPGLAYGTDFGSSERDFTAARTGLCIVSGAYDADASLKAMLEMRRRDPSAFAKYARAWSSPNRAAFLLLMAFDSQADVRARAVYELLRPAAFVGLAPAEQAQLAESALRHYDGCLVLYAAAQALGEYSARDRSSRELTDVADRLAAHRSALVRHAVTGRGT